MTVQADAEPGRHALLISVENYEPKIKCSIKGMEEQSFSRLRCPPTDAKIMEVCLRPA